MAIYPIKMLKDEEGNAFVPLTSTEALKTPDGKTLDEKLQNKLETTNIKAGTDINITVDGNNVTINNASKGVLIDNLTTETPGVGSLDAHQGKVLKEMIPEVVNNVTSTDSDKALSAYQGYLLSGKVVPTGGKEGQVLKKSSDTNWSLEWGDAADPNAIVGDGSIKKIVELTYEEYKELEAAGEVDEETEYHIANVEDGTYTYISEGQIQDMINKSTKDFVTQADIDRAMNSRVVYDHTLTESVSSWTVENLDLDGDGGIYHLSFIVKGDNSVVQSMYLRVNNFEGGHYAVYDRAWANPGVNKPSDINPQSYAIPGAGAWQFAEIINTTFGFTSMDIMKAPDGIKMNAVHSLISQGVQYGGTYTCNLYSTAENLTKLTFWQSGGNLVAGTRLVITKI